MRLKPRHHWRWIGAGFWAIADQGLFAGSNFLLNVLLTQWLTREAYGAFAVGFAVLLFIGAIHVALIGEPMLVFGPGRYREQASRYLGATIYGHLMLSGTALLLMLAAGTLYSARGSNELGSALVWLGIGCPCILLLWMTRRACYMLMEPRAAAMAGLGYLLMMAGGLVLLHRLRAISLVSSIIVLDASSLLAAFGLLLVIRPRLASAGGSFLRSVIIEHYRFGRWGVGTGVLYFSSGQLFAITLAAFHGLDSSAALRALMTLIAPATLVSLACASILSPTMVMAQAQGKLGRYVGPAMVIVLAVSLAYWVVVSIFAPQIFHLLYRGKYVEYASLLRILGAGLIATSAIDLLGAALRARHQPREVFLAFAASAAFASIAGTAMIYKWGTGGAVSAIVASAWVAAAVLTLSYFRTGRSSPS